MTDILDNELIKKYFGCRALCSEAHFINVDYDEHERCISTRVLQAMQELIQKGDCVLSINSNGYITESIWGSDPLMGIRTNALRLPDRFQNQEKECQFCATYKIHSCETHPHPSPEKCKCGCPSQDYHVSHAVCSKPKDEVEEHIRYMYGLLCNYRGYFEKDLRSLVELARNGPCKPQNNSQKCWCAGKCCAQREIA